MNNQNIARDQNWIRAKKRRLLKSIQNETSNEKLSAGDGTNSEVNDILLSEGKVQLNFYNRNQEQKRTF